MAESLWSAAREGLLDIVREYLVLHEGDEAFVNSTDEKGRSALHFAAVSGYEETVRLLAHHHADGYLRDEEGDTPLHLACKAGLPMSCYELGRHFPEALGIRNDKGDLPSDCPPPRCRAEVLNALLLAAAGDGSSIQALETLLAVGAAPDTWSPSGLSALMLAAGGGWAEAVAALLACGASVDLQDLAGRTALMFAVANDHLTATESLLLENPSLSVRDRRGKTAVDYAVPGSAVAEALRRKMQELEEAALAEQEALLAELEGGGGGATGKAKRGGRKKKGKRPNEARDGAKDDVGEATGGGEPAPAAPEGATGGDPAAASMRDAASSPPTVAETAPAGGEEAASAAPAAARGREHAAAAPAATGDGASGSSSESGSETTQGDLEGDKPRAEAGRASPPLASLEGTDPGGAAFAPACGGARTGSSEDDEEGWLPAGRTRGHKRQGAAEPTRLAAGAPPAAPARPGPSVSRPAAAKALPPTALASRAAAPPARKAATAAPAAALAPPKPPTEPTPAPWAAKAGLLSSTPTNGPATASSPSAFPPLPSHAGGERDESDGGDDAAVAKGEGAPAAPATSEEPGAAPSSAAGAVGASVDGASAHEAPAAGGTADAGAPAGPPAVSPASSRASPQPSDERDAAPQAEEAALSAEASAASAALNAQAQSHERLSRRLLGALQALSRAREDAEAQRAAFERALAEEYKRRAGLVRLAVGQAARLERQRCAEAFAVYLSDIGLSSVISHMASTMGSWMPELSPGGVELAARELLGGGGEASLGEALGASGAERATSGALGPGPLDTRGPAGGGPFRGATLVGPVGDPYPYEGAEGALGRAPASLPRGTPPAVGTSFGSAVFADAGGGRLGAPTASNGGAGGYPPPPASETGSRGGYGIDELELGHRPPSLAPLEHDPAGMSLVGTFETLGQLEGRSIFGGDGGAGAFGRDRGGGPAGEAGSDSLEGEIPSLPTDVSSLPAFFHDAPAAAPAPATSTPASVARAGGPAPAAPARLTDAPASRRATPPAPAQQLFSSDLPFSIFHDGPDVSSIMPPSPVPDGGGRGLGRASPSGAPLPPDPRAEPPLRAPAPPHGPSFSAPGVPHSFRAAPQASRFPSQPPSGAAGFPPPTRHEMGSFDPDPAASAYPRRGGYSASGLEYDAPPGGGAQAPGDRGSEAVAALSLNLGTGAF